jgi:hypothetical protein
VFKEATGFRLGPRGATSWDEKRGFNTRVNEAASPQRPYLEFLRRNAMVQHVTEPLIRLRMNTTSMGGTPRSTTTPQGRTSQPHILSYSALSSLKPPVFWVRLPLKYGMPADILRTHTHTHSHTLSSYHSTEAGMGSGGGWGVGYGLPWPRRSAPRSRAWQTLPAASTDAIQLKTWGLKCEVRRGRPRAGQILPGTS